MAIHGRIYLSAFLLALTCAGSLPAKKPLVDVPEPFRAEDVAWAAGKGNASIEGSAVLRTVGGEAKTCAALNVWLIPRSPYADARLLRTFGSTDSGYLSAYAKKKLPDPPAAFVEATRDVACDGQGHFAFRNIPAGTYYVLSRVTWGVPRRYYTSTEGGMLMRRVTVASGETAEVVLSA